MSVMEVRSRAKPSVSSKMAEGVSDTVDEVPNRPPLDPRTALPPTIGCVKHVFHSTVSQPGGGNRVYLAERLCEPRKGKQASARPSLSEGQRGSWSSWHEPEC
jgi:hypothetical protein